MMKSSFVDPLASWPEIRLPGEPGGNGMPGGQVTGQRRRNQSRALPGGLNKGFVAHLRPH